MHVSEPRAKRPDDAVRAARTSLVARINRRAVFEHFLLNSRASLRELASTLRMSVPTVRNAVGSLSKTGLIAELPEKHQPATGRPGSVYQLATATARLVGVSLSATRIEVAESGLDGAVADENRCSFATPQEYDALVACIADAIRALTPADARLLGVGLSVPGEIDLVEQRVLYSPNLHVTDGRYLARDVARRPGLRAVPVAMYKDTACGCLVERHWGLAAGRRNFVVLGVREGFGAGVWANGVLFGGRTTLTPEVGHIVVADGGEACSCGNRGCLETMATDAAFARRVNRRYGAAWDVATIIARAQRGELDVRDELDVSLHYLAVGIATLVNLFAPDLICLDSQMLDIAPDAQQRLEREAAELAFPPRRHLCAVRRRSIDNSRGALAAALHDFLGTVGPSHVHDRACDLWHEM